MFYINSPRFLYQNRGLLFYYCFRLFIQMEVYLHNIEYKSNLALLKI